MPRPSGDRGIGSVLPRCDAVRVLTGSAPFSGTLYELLKAHVNDAPPPILAVKPEVDPALEAIVMRMLAKSETARFPSFRDVSNALASLSRRRSQADRQAIIAAVAPRVAPAHARCHSGPHDTSMPPLAYDTAALQAHADAVEPSPITGGESLPRSQNGRGTRVVTAARRDGASRSGRIRDCIADRGH